MSNERREPKGAVEYQGGNAKYLQIAYGCLCEVSKKFVEGWVNPINQKTGDTIPDKWIKVYKELEAWVNKLEWYDHTYGENQYLGWKMHMEAGGINYILDLALNGSGAQKFMFSARNIDFNQPLEIAAWTNNSDGKLAVWLKQDGQTVYQYYKKGDMKNCPEPVEKTGIGGKRIWDWAETEKFLWDEMQTIITPAIAEAARQRIAERPNTQPTYSNEPEREYTGSEQAPSTSFPDNPVAQGLGDIVTAKQLGMIRAIAREINMNPEDECFRLMKCGTDELSKRGASTFIEHLQGVQKAGFKVTAAPAPTSAHPNGGLPTNAVDSTPAPVAAQPEPQQAPASAALETAHTAPATHDANCDCPQCHIPF